MTRDTHSALMQKIEKEIQKLQKQAKALQAKRRGPAMTSIIRSMREYDITPDDIAAAYNKKTGTSPARKSPAGAVAKRSVPIKYRHPQPGETWTGRGKAPRWITHAEAEGKNRSEFLFSG